MSEPEQTLLVFPCDFTIKVFGLANPEFEAAVILIIRHHITDLKEDAFAFRPSKDGKYTAISITVHVTSKDQLDNIYRELSSNPAVLMAL